VSRTLTLPDEVYDRLQHAADRQGVPVDQLLARWIDTLGQENPAPGMPASEAALLREINAGLSQVAWERYHFLQERRRVGELTAEEHQELLRLSDQIEAANVGRIQRLAELARLKGVSLRTLMGDLGIQALPSA
jgi:hypothetical protein